MDLPSINLNGDLPVEEGCVLDQPDSLPVECAVDACTYAGTTILLEGKYKIENDVLKYFNINKIKITFDN